MCINLFIISHAQIRNISRNPEIQTIDITNDTINTTTCTVQAPSIQTIDITNDTINTTTVQLCKIVDSYYRVKAVDNTSDIYQHLETFEKLANDTFTFWVSFHYVHLS